MVNEKSEKSDKKAEIVEKPSLLEIANKVLEENKVPIILWEKEQENKEFLIEFVEFESENVVNCLLFKNKKSVEYQISIKPKALNTQMKKFEPKENDIFNIKYLGNKSQEEGFDFKSFVVKKFDVKENKFISTKQIH